MVIFQEIKKHYKYASYVLRHKWFVGKACFKRGLIWEGIKHDWSKFLPSEWFPYANYFWPNGEKRQIRDKTGYYKPTDTGDKAFDFAWLLHQKRNRHHWQWWILPEDSGGVKVLPMSHKSILEMICDWQGASMAQGNGPNIRPWWEANNSKMQLHPETRLIVERIVFTEWT